MQFMTELAKLIRTDRGLAVNETQINEEVIRILEFESDLANVRDKHLTLRGNLPETTRDFLSVLNHCLSGNVSSTLLQLSGLFFSSLIPRLQILRRTVTTRGFFTTRWSWGISMPTSPLRSTHR